MDSQNEHQKILQVIRAHRRPQTSHESASYLGTTHVVYNTSVPDLRKIAKRWAKEHRSCSVNDLRGVVDSLYHGDSREEKVIASMILGLFPKLLVQLPSKEFDRWLSVLRGWEEVDQLCCGPLVAWLLDDYAIKQAILKKWNRDTQIEKRRASLVVLCSSVRRDASESLRDLSFQFIDALKKEKHVMITKAISWLLRSLIKYHKTDVATYLKKNASSLPKIAVRELRRKLETGRK